MGVFVKLAIEYFSPLELVFYRSALGCILVLAVARFWRRSLRTGNFRVHFWRGFTGFISLTLFFYALPLMHLSTSVALLQTSPLFFTLLTFLFLRERISPLLLCALALSFIGMLFVLRPGIDDDNIYPGIAAVAAGAMAGCAYFNIRKLGILNEGGIRTVFYFAAISAFLAAILMVVFGEWSPLSTEGVLLLFAIGITATAAQFALTRGLHYGQSIVASSLMYSSIIFAGIFDYVVWDGGVDTLAWIGIIMISGGGISALWINLQTVKHTKPLPITPKN